MKPENPDGGWGRVSVTTVTGNIMLDVIKEPTSLFKKKDAGVVVWSVHMYS